MRTAEDMLEEKGQHIISVPADATVRKAIEVMVKNKIGAVLVKRGGQHVGIWSERDLLKNTLDPGFDPSTVLIETVMTTGLVKAAHSETAYGLLDLFLGRRLRHVLIEKDRKFIGLLSIGDVVKANLMEKTREIQQLNAVVSWEYYEDWRWKSD